MSIQPELRSAIAAHPTWFGLAAAAATVALGAACAAAPADVQLVAWSLPFALALAVGQLWGPRAALGALAGAALGRVLGGDAPGAAAAATAADALGLVLSLAAVGRLRRGSRRSGMPFLLAFLLLGALLPVLLATLADAALAGSLAPSPSPPALLHAVAGRLVGVLALALPLLLWLPRVLAKARLDLAADGGFQGGLALARGGLAAGLEAALLLGLPLALGPFLPFETHAVPYAVVVLAAALRRGLAFAATTFASVAAALVLFEPSALSLQAELELVALGLGGAVVGRAATDQRVELVLRRGTERALRRSEARLYGILRSLDGAVRSMEPASGEVLYLSHATEELYGRSLAELWERPALLREAVHPEDAAAYEAMRERAVETGAAALDYRIVRPDGEVRWIHDRVRLIRDEAGRPTRLDGIATDVTQRVAYEAALREREGMYRALTEHASDVTLILDADDACTYVSPAVVRSLGRDPATLFGRRLDELLHADDRRRVAEALARTRADRELALDVLDFRLRHKDGRWIVFEGICTNLIEQPGVDGLVLNCRDVSARLEAEDERRRLELQMQHTQKLESLGILAGGIAHDFNNLLLTILGNAGLAEKDLPAGSPARANVLDIERAAERATMLCKQLLG